MPTSTVEDYLKSILRLEEDAGRDLTVGGIADDLGVTPGTVSSMMRHLSEEGLIDYVPRKSVTLLNEGRQQALRVVRRHRLIEAFLVEIMQLDWSEVHEEAEILEHVVSDRLLHRMDDMLGHPSHDPHGDPIPDAAGNFTDEKLHLLSEVDSGRFRIVRVANSDSKFLDWLRDNQMLPGCEFELAGRDLVAGIIQLRIHPNHDAIRIGERAAANIHVEAIASL